MTTSATTPETFSSVDPRSGEVVATLPVDGAAEVGAAVEAARGAAGWWDRLGFDGRRRRLRAITSAVAERAGEACALVQRETGKSRDDALMEFMGTLLHLDWAGRHARRVLGPRRVASGLLMADHRATVEYQPLGVVAVIGPWNYPLLTPMGSIAYALAAGNAVVFKPSEFTSATGRWLADVVAGAVPEQPLLQTVTGFGATGEALCRAGVDKVSFTGSARTARKVLATCAESLTPTLIEGGAKDAMVVCDDADLEAAARAAVWGGMQNSGQACVGIERVYATSAVYDELLARIAAHARALAPPGRGGAGYGAVTTSAQLDVIRTHIDDALARGARALVGGPDAVQAPYVEPVVLADVPEDALVLREETFGPVLPVVRVRDAEEGVRRANGLPYGLGSAVFGNAGALDLARRLRGGMTSINSVTAYAAVPALPFGGVGESGFGRIHGADGLRSFASAKAITQRRFPLPFDVFSFDRPSWLLPALARALRIRYGARPRLP